MPDYADSVHLTNDEIENLFDENLAVFADQLDAIDVAEDPRQAERLRQGAVVTLAALLQLATALLFNTAGDIDEQVDVALHKAGRRKGSLRFEPVIARLHPDNGIPPANLPLGEALFAAREALPELNAAARGQ